MIHDELQFAISQYLDGTLPADQVDALRKRLESDPEARQLLDEYTSLDAAMKAEPLPAMRWNALAQRIAQAAAVQADARRLPETVDGQPLTDEQEYQLTQYLDDELPAEESAQVRQQIAANPAAQKALADHRAVDTILKHAWPLPHIEWDRLHSYLSDTIAEEAQASRMRIGNWLTYGTRVALAACLLLAIGLAVRFAMNDGGTVAPRQVAQVELAGPQVAAGEPTVQMSFGPSEDYASGSYDPYASPLVAVPSRVQIASSYRPETDGVWLPY